jgi:hypothetical protein
VYSKWKENGFKSSRNWESVFGKDINTDEIFMAYYFSEFSNELVKTGKDVFPLPMFVNAALNRPGREPGAYPSAAPLPHIADIWKAGGTSIDFYLLIFTSPILRIGVICISPRRSAFYS